MVANAVHGPYDNLSMPPDSTGKRMGLLRNVVVDYVGSGNPARIFAVDQEVSGSTSGFVGFVTAAGGDEVAGQISLIARIASPVTLPTLGENLIVNSLIYGTVGDLESIYTPGTVISSGDNPSFTAKIDNVGNQFVRFAEGEPQTSPFGTLRVNELTTLADYTFRYGVPTEEWDQTTVGGGSQILHLPDAATVAIEANTGSGDRACLTSHRYHLYQPNIGSLVAMTIVLGDSGEANNKRRWGIYDDDDGLFFELDGSTLNVVMRSSTTGSLVETKVAQSAWNIDRVNGELGNRNTSSYDLSSQDLNIYWIDYQWLGAGRVRFGVFTPNGDRVVCHEFQNSGANSAPYMAQASLPVRIESINDGGTTVSAKRINLTCATVSTEGRLVDPRSRKTLKWTEESDTKTAAGTEIPLVSFRPKTTLSSVANRKVSVPEKTTVYVATNPIILRLRRGVTLTGAAFADATNPDSAAQVDTTATALATPGRLMLTYFLDPGCHDIALPQNFGLLSENMRLLADGSQTDLFSWTIEEVNLAANGTVRCAATWIDIGGA